MPEVTCSGEDHGDAGRIRRRDHRRITLAATRLHHGGDGDRVTIALETALTDADVAELDRRLDRFDASARSPWTKKVLALIGKHPRVAASQLAKKLGLDETEPFKIDVRKLKKLGLTQSFEVGYEISPRGRAYLEKSKRKTK